MYQTPPDLSTSTLSGSLYDSRYEHDNCGTGFVAHGSGNPSHRLLQIGLEALTRLEHRGAVAADGKSGDGAGVKTQIPQRLFRDEAERRQAPLAPDDPMAVGSFFLPRARTAARAAIERVLEAQGLPLLAWRAVPLDATALGDAARASLPAIEHAIIAPGRSAGEDAFERELYLARKRIEREVDGVYVCSLSCRHIVYKALCAPHQLAKFYHDLSDPRFETAFTLYHQRFSTNTMPSWALAQPLRLLAHNGEINTLWGNCAWMRSREQELPKALRPVLDARSSDSANLDAALELLTRNGRDVLHALAMLIVPAWEETDYSLPADLAAFYHYHGSLMEPWDGPAALVFADGRYVGAALDRNGLRPCRYQVTRDGLVVAGSEVGVVDLDDDEVIEKGRLGPGQMLAVDLNEHRVIHDDEIKSRLAAQLPYPDWVHVRNLAARREPPVALAEVIDHPEALVRLQRLFGYSRESISIVLAPMAERGTRATWSMGDDTPLPPMAQVPRPLYTFFRQRFAQVTNPAIDPLREAVVMSLKTWLGPRPTLLDDGPQPPVLEIPSPVLGLGQLAELREQTEFPTAAIDCLFPLSRDALSDALDQVCIQAETAVRAGTQILILTDRGVTHSLAPIPMALVVGALHHHLVGVGLRTRVGLVVEAGDCWDVHHVAVLVGYGAGAVCPWLALAGARALAEDGGEQRTIAALSKGLRKLMSKMGISTVTSYRGGQLFDILGLADDVVARCFKGSSSPVSGLSMEEVADAALARHAAVFGADAESVSLPDLGLARYRRDGEHHAWAPPTVRALQRAVGSERRPKKSEPDAADWAAYRSATRPRFPAALRDLVELSPAGPPVDLAEVEPAAVIARRFVSSAMSFGALSREAHQTLSIGMNRLGARSNTGEGGEDPATYQPLPNGDRADNKIKQVASGRFGVTAQYLAHADEIEIKVAQGSKPGEGGQLPGHKVSALIAQLRHSQPGVPLISPPPHHDIYSIEDLAQLIYDLKRCNPQARVAVKLVAEAGVGTVAAGVAKAYADCVVISGHSGGTGASALSSIKHVGSPWELGLAETQQVLIRNGLRSRVRVRVDGGFQSAADVIFGAILGAEEFGFGTAPLVAMGCDMARQCHLNSCPTGIATQREDLRAKFRGKPEHVVRFFTSLAEDVRTQLAALGVRSMDELVGRVDLLQQTKKMAGLDLALVLARAEGDSPRCCTTRNDRPDDHPPLEDALIKPALRAVEQGTPYRANATIRNRDRSVGARISGALAKRWGGEPPPGAAVTLHLTGTAGQSFGAFAGTCMTLILEGEANDYVAKGLSGGSVVLRPSGRARKAPQHNVILGNVALYGATGGRLFAAGRAGERFAVRNSGAVAVVEGVGDHGCEYMTGGTVVVLGNTGINFGAGMTGGAAFILDANDVMPDRVNAAQVECTRLSEPDVAELKGLIAEHLQLTESTHAAELLAQWARRQAEFWKVVPYGAEKESEVMEVHTEQELPVAAR